MLVDVRYVDTLDAEWAMAYRDGEAYFLIRRGCKVCPTMLKEAWEAFLDMAEVAV